MDNITLANAALTKRTSLAEQRTALTNDTSLTEAEKNVRAETLGVEMAQLAAQADEYVRKAQTQAEQRSALAASPTGMPTGEREVRHGDLLGAEVRAITGAAGLGASFTPAENATYALDFLAKQSVFLRSGVQVIRTTGDSIVLPHMTSDGSAAATAEAGTIGLSDPVAESLVSVPRKFSQGVRISNEAISDAQPSALAQLEQSLIRSVGLAYDLGAFEGSGTAPNVRGMKNVVGIQTFPLGANGALLTNLDPISDAILMIAEANGNDENAVIVMAPRTWKQIAKLKEATGSAKSLVQDSAGSASGVVQKTLFGRPVFLSGNLSIAETQGSSSLASSIYVYDPSQVYAVIRDDATFTVNPYVYGATDETLVTAKLRADILCPNPTAIVRVTGVL